MEEAANVALSMDSEETAAAAAASAASAASGGIAAARIPADEDERAFVRGRTRFRARQRGS